MKGRRQILVSAYACEPDKGSEPGVGWNWVREIARFHDTWVLTRSNNRFSIEQALLREPIANTQWIYLDLPRTLKFWKKGHRGSRLYYYLWQMQAYGRVKRLHTEIGFDLVHHLTFGKYWAPSFLSFLKLPFVWGPLGGAESAPESFREDFGWKGKGYERLRDVARRAAEGDPFLRITAQHSALALAKTGETAQRLRHLGCRYVDIQSEVAMPRKEIDALAALTRSDDQRFKLLSIGRFLHWKGFHLGLKAFARLLQTGHDAQYTLIGDGPERESLRILAHRLKLDDHVRFLGNLSRERTLAELSESDLLVHPSLHDSGGWVCVEAMACGRPVICLDLGGPSLQVTAETGFKIPATNPVQAVKDMSHAMLRLGQDSELRLAMGAAGQKRVKELFALETKGPELAALYEELLQTIQPFDRFRELRFARRANFEPGPNNIDQPALSEFGRKLD